MAQSAAMIVPGTAPDPRGPLFGRKPRGLAESSPLKSLPLWTDPPYVVVAPRPVSGTPVAVSVPSPIGYVTLLICQWLHGSERDLNWCGAAVAWSGCSWCEEHEQIVFPSGRKPF